MFSQRNNYLFENKQISIFIERLSITGRRRERKREELKLSYLIRTIIDLIEEEGEESWSKLFVSAG